MSLWSDIDWEESDKEIPCRPKRQRVSGQLPNHDEQQTKLPVINPNQAASDQTKLAFCPDILKDILIKILLIDSLCGCFRSCGRFFSRGKNRFVEMSSGGPKGRGVSNGFRKRGWEGDDFDKDITEDHDFTSALGFCATLLSVFRLCLGDLLWTGLVCTSFCWVNRNTSQRFASNNFLGDQTLKHVAIGNLIPYRNMLLLLLHQATEGIIMLEQPLGSCMPSVPIFRSTWKFLKWNYVVVWLGAYGAESKKPIKIFAPVTWIENLKKKIPQKQQFVKLCTSKDGKHTGKSAALKNSQHYPQPFGAQVAKQFSAHLGVPPFCAPSVHATNCFIQKHDWSLAKLDSIHSWLDNKIAKLRDAHVG